jgi:uncharacterized protein YmfQ (DUF2313 family)
LVEEADPRTVAELFADWESVAGLPDSCAAAFGGDQTWRSVGPPWSAA